MWPPSRAGCAGDIECGEYAGISRDTADLKLTHYLGVLDNVCYVNLSMKLAQSAGLRTARSNPERAGARDHASVWLGAQTGTFRIQRQEIRGVVGLKSHTGSACR